MSQLRSLVGLDRDACMISRLRHYQPEPDSPASEMRSKANSPQGVMKRRDLSDKLIEKVLLGNPRRLYSIDCKIKNLNL